LPPFQAGVGSGTLTVNRKGQAHDMKAFEFVVRVNLLGTYSVASKCAAWMAKNADDGKDNERGVIINVASVAAFDGQDGQASYSASKGGVAAMTLPMARDLSRQNVRVLTIAPGTFGTPMTAPLESGRGASIGDGLKSSTLFPKRFGIASEFASLACEMVTNSMFNGETVRLDGGIRMPRL
jgi:NAD(P)-dependent dehydrogenase (short-subunit alcohol dehydrogenase family)